MIFEPTRIEGVLRVLTEPHVDARGSFARTFSSGEFTEHGLPSLFEDSSISSNLRAGTLRGMHFQNAPFEEAKFVRCVRGAIFDVAVDIRPGSPTRGQWIGERLTAENGMGLFIPGGFAHGFQTLEDESDVLYQITPAYVPGHGQGARWDDPAFGIAWPLPNPILSERDAAYADWMP